METKDDAENKIRVNIMLGADQIKYLKMRAKRNRTNVSYEIRVLIDASIGRHFIGRRPGDPKEGK
jgi:hypothetical protein